MQTHRHITSSHIANWAKNNIEARSELPRLVRRLIHGITTPGSCDFPSGVDVSSPGFDGELLCKEETTWTPAGQSYWELSCNRNPTGKANSDHKKRTRPKSKPNPKPEDEANQSYDERTQQIDEVNRCESTLVIVTARKWTTKEEWLKAKRSENKWKAIWAFDAGDLEQWLEQCPAVALQFAEELGTSGPEIESLNQYWRIWSSQTSPAITSDAFHTSRENSLNRLIAELRKKLNSTQTEFCHIKADSVEEAVAFVCSALSAQPDLAAHSLVITDAAGWHYVEKNESLKIVIATQSEVAQRPTLRAGLVVVIPIATVESEQAFRGSANHQVGMDVIIERPDIDQFRNVLAALGVEESHRVAADMGRSWSIYRRCFARNDAIRKPAWMDKPQAAPLSTLCLLGAWLSDNEKDKEWVSVLAGRTYDAVEKDLRYLAQLSDSPVLAIGEVWKAKSPWELLDLFHNRMTQGELERFFSMAQQILSTPDPELELPDKDRWMAQVFSKICPESGVKTRPESGLLIRSMCETLVKFSTFNLYAAKVKRLVRELLDEADAMRWLSLYPVLQALAEAAPDEFINAIEKSLNQPDTPVTRLITETDSSSGTGRCWQATLLWALETLAGLPKYFHRVILILAQLAKVPYRGNWGNTPMASLVDIFRSWSPQTNTNTQQPISSLERLIVEEPSVAFDLLDRLLYEFYYRDSGGEHREIICAVAADGLITLSNNSLQRIIKLIEKHDLFDEQRIDKILFLMESYAESSVSDEDKETLRVDLRRKIHWYRNYGSKRSNTAAKEITTIEQIYQKLEPADLFSRHHWLFADGDINVPWREEYGNSKGENRIERERANSLKEIIAALGMAGVERLALCCGNPFWVGVTLAKLGVAETELVAWIVEKSGEFISVEPEAEIIRGLLFALEYSQSLKLVEAVIDVGKQQGWEAEKIAKVLALVPQNRGTWELLAAYGAEVENAYWSTIDPSFLLRNDADAQIFALERLLKLGRPRTALRLCGYDSVDKVDAVLLAEILEHILQGEEPEGDLFNVGDAIEHLEASQAIDKPRLIRLEFHFFPALRHGDEYHAQTLYEAIMSEPPLFVELLRIRYKPQDETEETEPEGITQASVDIVMDIFDSCQRQPGTRPDGSIDPAAFVQFIEATRQLALGANRLKMCDYTLGRILAYAPTDNEDGIWPFKPAREALDRSDCVDMREGLQNGVHNKHGINQNRKWADFYRQQAQALQQSCIYYLHMTMENLAHDFEEHERRDEVNNQFRREMY